MHKKLGLDYTGRKKYPKYLNGGKARKAARQIKKKLAQAKTNRRMVHLISNFAGLGQVCQEVNLGRMEFQQFYAEISENEGLTDQNTNGVPKPSRSLLVNNHLMS